MEEDRRTKTAKGAFRPIEPNLIPNLSSIRDTLRGRLDQTEEFQSNPLERIKDLAQAYSSMLVPYTLPLIFQVHPSQCGERMPFSKKLQQAQQWTTAPFAFLLSTSQVPHETLTLNIRAIRSKIASGSVKAKAGKTLEGNACITLAYGGEEVQVKCVGQEAVFTEYFRQTWVPAEVQVSSDSTVSSTLKLSIPAAAAFMSDTVFKDLLELFSLSWACGMLECEASCTAECKECQTEYLFRLASLTLHLKHVRMTDAIAYLEAYLQESRLGKEKKAAKDLAPHKHHVDFQVFQVPQPVDILDEADQNRLDILTERVCKEIERKILHRFSPEQREEFWRELDQLSKKQNIDFKYLAGKVLLHNYRRHFADDDATFEDVLDLLRRPNEGRKVTRRLTVPQEFIFGLLECPNRCDHCAKPLREKIERRPDDHVMNPVYLCEGCRQILQCVIPALCTTEPRNMTYKFSGRLCLLKPELKKRSRD